MVAFFIYINSNIYMFSAMALILLEINNTLTDCDKGYIAVRCAVNSNQLGKKIKNFADKV